MHDLHTIPALLALARDVLVSELMPLLPEERKIDALLVAETIALAARAAEAEGGPMRAVLHDLEILYGPLTAARCPQCGEREPADPRIAVREEAGEAEVTLLRRFANDLRNGAFETSRSRDQAARAILWRLTIARLRQSNPKFLAANGFD